MANAKTFAKTFETYITVCADSIDRLRKCDVMRALDVANENGDLVLFSRWLKEQRPDLAQEVEECLEEF